MKNLQLWSESLGPILEYWYLERGLLACSFRPHYSKKIRKQGFNFGKHIKYSPSTPRRRNWKRNNQSIVFEKLQFQNVFSLHKNTKSAVWRALEKAHGFRDRLLWTVGLTEEIKLRFQNSSAHCGASWWYSFANFLFILYWKCNEKLYFFSGGYFNCNLFYFTPRNSQNRKWLHLWKIIFTFSKITSKWLWKPDFCPNFFLIDTNVLVTSHETFGTNSQSRISYYKGNFCKIVTIISRSRFVKNLKVQFTWQPVELSF